MSTYGTGFVMELMNELTGPVRRLGTVMKSEAARTFPPSVAGAPIFMPLKAKITPEEQQAAQGLGLDIGLALATRGAGKLVGSAAAPVLKRLAPMAPKAADLLVKAGRSAQVFANLEAVTPSDEEAADAGKRIKEVFESAGLGALVPPVGKLLSPLGNAVQGFIHAHFAPKPTEILGKGAKQFEKAFAKRYSTLGTKEIVDTELPKVAETAQQLANEMRGTIQPTSAAKLIEPEIDSIISTGTIGKGAGAASYKFSPLDVSQPTTGKTFYHGTKAAVGSAAELQPDVFGKPDAKFGLGLYLTDNAKVAAGYATTKGVGEAGNVLPVAVGNLKLLDLDKTLPSGLEKAFAFEGEALPAGATGRQAFSHLRQAMEDAQLPTSEAVEIYQDLAGKLSTAGYDGLRVTGGTTKAAKFGLHNTLVLFPDYGVGKPLAEKFVAQRVIPASGEAVRTAARSLAKEITPEWYSTSEKKMTGLKFAVASLGGALKAARNRLDELGEQESSKLLDSYQVLLNQASEEFLKGRRVFGKVGQTLQTPINEAQVAAITAELDRIGKGVTDLPTIQIARTGLERLKGALRDGEYAVAARIMVGDVWRRNLFTLSSFVADSIGNASKTLQAGLEGLTADAFDYIATGRPGLRLAGMMNAIYRGNPYGKQINSILSPTALGIRFGPFIGEKADKVLFPGAALKTGVDSMFKRFGFLSSLYGDALQEARGRGIQGVERTAFIRNLVLKPTDEMMQKARATGDRLSFAEPLPKSVRSIANNPAIQLFVAPFGAFQYRFARWAAEFTPASPEFWGKVRAGSATGQDLAAFLTRQASGIGAVSLTDNTIYQNIDFETFEWVDPETGKRVSLSQYSPLPEAIAVAAILHKQPQEAIAALRRSSLNFGGGLLSGVVDSFDRIKVGRPIPASVGEQFDRALLTLLPGQAVLRALKDALDTTKREGVLGQLPVISKGQPERISPTTGNPESTLREIVGTNLPAPAAMGSRGTQRTPDPLESELRRLRKMGQAIQIRAPRLRLPGDQEPTDEQQRQFERDRGQLRFKTLAPLIKSEAYQQLTNPQKANLLQELQAETSRIAKGKVLRSLVRRVQ
jgi:hypothetical protein